MDVVVQNVTAFVTLRYKSYLPGGIAISLYFFLRKIRVTLSGILTCKMNKVRLRINDHICVHDFHSTTKGK
jgi:hypothetical protein